MKDKKVIVLVVLSVLAVISLVRGITSHPARKTDTSYTYTAQATKPQTSSSQGATFTQRRAKKSQFASWKRSPFMPSSTLTVSPAIVLGGIMWDKNNPKAMIGDAIVKKGDRVGSYTVIDIQKTSVILNDGIKDIELRLKE